MPETIDIEKLFCMNSKKLKIPKLLIKAVCMTESSMNPNAKRHEPEFWIKYMKDKPEWAGRDPLEVSTSYGLMQVMYSTAAMFGFNGPGDELLNPVYNIAMGCAVLRSRINEVEKANLHVRWVLSPLAIALARYNGGSWRNPDENGQLRNLSYVHKVGKNWADLRAKGELDSCLEAESGLFVCPE